MRYIVDLEHTADGITGQVTPEDSGEPKPFSGWLDLLRLLESPNDEPGQR